MGKDKLTRQDKKFVEIVAETGNKTLAVKKAYGVEDENYAGVKGNRLIRKDKIQNAIMSIADSIPDSLLIETHLEGLKATNKEGKDFATRHKYLDSGYKIKGTYANVKVEFSFDKKEYKDYE